MRALRRVFTPVSAALVFGGCIHPLDEFQPPASTDAGLTTNGDAAYASLETGASDTALVPALDAANDSADDSATVPETAIDAACVCTKQVGGKCKEWSPPDCGK